VKNRPLETGLVVVALVVGVVAFAHTQDPPAGHSNQKVAHESGAHDEDDVVPLEQAPEAVRAAAIKLAGAAENITKVIREKDDDHVKFEIKFKDGAASGAALFSSAGELMEVERSMKEMDLPAAAMSALKRAYPKATFADMQTVSKMFYEVEVEINGQKREVYVNAVGEIEDDSKKDENGLSTGVEEKEIKKIK